VEETKKVVYRARKGECLESVRLFNITYPVVIHAILDLVFVRLIPIILEQRIHSLLIRLCMCSLYCS